MNESDPGLAEVEAPADRQHRQAIFELSNVKKSFASRGGSVGAVDDVSLSVHAGEFVSLLGPSGCGKSTLLNMMAGLIFADSGLVAYKGQQLTSPNTQAGYLTQDDALFPWRTVRSNVGLPLEIRGVPKVDRRRQIDEQIRAVGLAGFENHYPSQLSGGMRKRVSIARTLIYKPSTLLLDEPFGALDAQTKIVLQEQLLALCADRGLTVVMVTHDINEAIKLSDRIVVFTRRPARIKTEVTVDMPRPRDLVNAHPGEEELRSFVWHNLGAELREQESNHVANELERQG